MQEVFNSDSAEYGGSSQDNDGGIYSEPVEAHGHKHSLSITVPPLGIVALNPWFLLKRLKNQLRKQLILKSN
ncbi:MAG: alpha amylase C-terminal domain-containing protein [Planctomycetaceae bacterium]